jgi:hypothetical protein
VTGANNNKNDDNDDKRNLEVTIFHDDASSIPRDAMRLEARGDRRGFVVVVDVAEEDMTLQVVLPPTTGLVDLVVETIGGGTRLMNPDANDRNDAHHTAMMKRRHGKESEETFMMLVTKAECLYFYQRRDGTRGPLSLLEWNVVRRIFVTYV